MLSSALHTPFIKGLKFFLIVSSENKTWLFIHIVSWDDLNKLPYFLDK